MTNPYIPLEQVMTGAAVGLEYAGITLDQFDPDAPLCGCRLCGAVYQTKYHRELHLHRKLLTGHGDPPKLLALVLDLNDIWREQHAKSEHTVSQVEELTKTGAAFTPDAAATLAPFGVIPLGNMSQEITDALFESNRKPDLTVLEGGE